MLENARKNIFHIFIQKIFNTKEDFTVNLYISITRFYQ